MSRRPVSVIVSTVGRPYFLGSLLQAISTNLGSVSEIVLINNDRVTSLEVFESVVRRHLADFAGDINIVTLNCAAGGLSTARNKGASVATGQYLYFLDDECQLTRQNGHALDVITNAGHAAAFGGYCDLPLDGWEVPNLGAAGIALEEGSQVLGAIDYMSGGNLLIHREVFNDLGGFNELLGRGSGCIELGEDSELAFRLLDSGHDIIYEPSMMVYHGVRSVKSSFFWQLKESYNRGKASRVIRVLRSKIFDTDDFICQADDRKKRIHAVEAFKNSATPKLLHFPLLAVGFLVAGKDAGKVIERQNIG